MDPQERLEYWTQKRAGLERAAKLVAGLGVVIALVAAAAFVFAFVHLGLGAFRLQAREAAIGAFELALGVFLVVLVRAIARLEGRIKAAAVDCVWHAGAAKLTVIGGSKGAVSDPGTSSDDAPRDVA